MAQTAAAIPEKIFFKIGEVCDIVDVQAHVLRYWETEFPQLSPQKNRSGQRTYRRRDVEIALRIKELLYEDLYTIAGAKKRLQMEMRETSRLKIVRNEPEEQETPRLKPVEKIAVEKVEEKIDEEEETASILDEELEIEDFESNIAEFEADEDEDAVLLDDERREAIRTLASELFELRELLRKRTTDSAPSNQRRF